jgi:long-chain acyl-CoA synthetase
MVAPEPFTIENEMMTPTLKLRRHVITKRYREDLERLYGR